MNLDIFSLPFRLTEVILVCTSRSTQNSNPESTSTTSSMVALKINVNSHARLFRHRKVNFQAKKCTSCGQKQYNSIAQFNVILVCLCKYCVRQTIFCVELCLFEEVLLMCLNGSQNAGKLHSESTKFQIFLGDLMPKNSLVELVQITHVKSQKRRFEVVPLVPWIPKFPLFVLLVWNKLVLRQ